MCIRDSIFTTDTSSLLVLLTLETVKMPLLGFGYTDTRLCVSTVSYTHLDVYKRQVQRNTNLQGIKIRACKSSSIGPVKSHFCGSESCQTHGGFQLITIAGISRIIIIIKKGTLRAGLPGRCFQSPFFIIGTGIYERPIGWRKGCWLKAFYQWQCYSIANCNVTSLHTGIVSIRSGRCQRYTIYSRCSIGYSNSWLCRGSRRSTLESPAIGGSACTDGGVCKTYGASRANA